MFNVGNAIVTKVLLLGLVHAGAQSPSVVGRLYVVKGRAHVIGAEHATQLVQVCRSNDRIEVGDHSIAIVWMLGSGARYQLASPGEVKLVKGVPIALRGASPKPLSKLSTGVTAVFQEPMSQAAVQVRGVENLRITPTGGLLEAPRTISWDVVPNAATYDVSIAKDGAAESSFQIHEMTGTSAAIPDNVLRPCNVYRLTLTAKTSSGGRAVSFRTLRFISKSQLTSLERAEKQLDALLSPSPEVPLAKADLYKEYGLYRQSLACLSKLKKPTDAEKEEIATLASLAEGRS